MPHTQPTLAYQLYVGVNIAAASFTASWALDGQSDARPQTFDQTPSGFSAFQQRLLATGVPPAATFSVKPPSPCQATVPPITSGRCALNQLSDWALRVRTRPTSLARP